MLIELAESEKHKVRALSATVLSASVECEYIECERECDYIECDDIGCERECERDCTSCSNYTTLAQGDQIRASSYLKAARAVKEHSAPLRSGKEAQQVK